MSNLSANGRLHVKSEAVQITDKFRKREFVVEIGADSKYPQFVQFQLTGDRCDLLDRAEVGEDVEIEFSLRGREWQPPNGDPVRYFNSLDVWTVRITGAQKAPEKPAPTPQAPADDSEIPF